MNTLQMRYFVMTANYLSFTKAAQELYISQPAVSKQIAALERELGAKLFRRSKIEGLRLTKAGSLYLPLFNSFLQGLSDVSKQAQQLEPVEVKLRIGLVDGWAMSGPVEAAFHSFCAKHPQIQVEFEAYPFNQLNRLLASNALDAVLTMDLPGVKPIKQELGSIKVCDLPRTLLFSRKHPNVNLPNLHPSDFKDDNLYILNSEEAPPINNRLLCHSLGFEPKMREMPNRESILMAISIGRGFALFDEWTRYKDYDGFAQIPTGISTPVVMLWKPENPNPGLKILTAEFLAVLELK